MGRKHVTKAKSIIDNVDVTTNPVSEIVKVENIDFYSFFVSWTTALISGEIFIDVTNDNVDSPAVVPVWFTLDFLEQILIDTDNEKHKIEIDRVDWKFCRVRYVNAAGTGTIKIDYKASTRGA